MDLDLITTTEAAELLKVTPSAINHYARKGILEAFTLPGGHRRYRREDVMALLAVAATEPKAAS